MEKQRKAIALGDFDGMHLAHKTVVTGASDVTIYCVNNRFTLLQKSIFERRFPNAVFADFEKLKNMSGEDFINKILIEELGAKMLLCGYNFRFGKNATWTANALREYLEERDVWVRILEHLDFRGEPISSTRIRNCIKDGRIEDANEMLGYNFTFESEVIGGDRRGRTIGFPTINQALPEGLTPVKYGVYESRAEIGGKMYKALSNIGMRPSFKLEKPISESHIIGFEGDLYGKTVRLELVRYIREEKKFPSIEKLKEQLENDKSSII
jgi:riboflavin kinase/FMN adenylyltransferase